MSKDDWAEQRRNRMRAAVMPRGSGGLSYMERVRQLRETSAESAVDWDMWRSMASVALWEALFLSVGQDPTQPPPLDGTDDMSKEYRKRLRVAESHRGPGGTLAPMLTAGLNGDPMVSLPRFASWAMSLGWQLPDAFPRPAIDDALTLGAQGVGGADTAKAAPLGTFADESVAAAAGPVTYAAADIEEAKWAAQAADKALNWKARAQAQACIIWRQWRRRGGNPTPYGIRGELRRWCEANDVRTETRVIPTEDTLRVHVLAAKHWTPPRDLTR